MRNSFLLMLLCIVGCEQTIPDYSEKQIKNNEGEITIVILDKFGREKIEKPFQLLKSEVLELNDILKKGIDSLNIVEERTINLEDYKIQYLPYLNDLGEKEVFVTCFCPSAIGKNWKTEILTVSGGGECIIRGTINLTTRMSGFSAQEPL